MTLPQTTTILLACLILTTTEATSEELAATKPQARLHHVWKQLDGERWSERHEAIQVRNQSGPVDLIFVGDSITHFWEFEDRGRSTWNQYYASRNAVNMGFAGDRTEHVLWRLQNGAVDGIAPKVAVVLIGTNNWKRDQPAAIATGIESIVDELLERLPNTKVLLLSIFPRDVPGSEKWIRITETNALLKDKERDSRVSFLDLGNEFLNKNGEIPKTIMPDRLHPSAKGYQIWAKAMEPTLIELMK